MKPLEKLILTLLTVILIGGLSLTCKAQDTMTVTFYFPAEVASMTTQQIDSLDKLMQQGYAPVEIMGYANYLPNLTTKEDNMDLARRRAEEVAAVVDLKPTGWAVEIGGAEFRKVTITFVKESKELSFQPGLDITTELVKSDTSTAIDVNDSTNSLVSSNPNSISNNTINISRVDTVFVTVTDTIYIVSAIIEPIETTQSKANDCCGGDRSVMQVWQEYKSLQTKARRCKTYEDKQLYTAKARAVRSCWLSMYRKYKSDIVKAKTKSDYKSVSTNYKNKIRHKHRLRPTRGLNATMFSRLFPWSAC
jgi:hypothetical protein